MRSVASNWILATVVACSSSRPSDEEFPSVSVTHWTERTELFMEHDALIAGRETFFAVHLTDLRTFKPLEASAPVLELSREGAPRLSFTASVPSRSGLYRMVGNMPAPGRYRMTLRVTEPADVHQLGEVTVQREGTEARKAATEESSELTISFLKEQQWSTHFRTEGVLKRSLRASVRVRAEVRPRTGGEARVVAPLAGRIVVENALPPPGSKVRTGQVLARIAPQVSEPEDRASLELAVIAADSELEAARRERERAERLFAARAVPARRLEQARQREIVGQAQRDAAQKRLRQLEETLRSGGGGAEESHVRLTSPIAGVLLESRATAGAVVEKGEELFRLVDPSTVYVVGSVPEADVPRLRRPATAAIELSGPSLRDRIEIPSGRLLAIGPAVETDSRTAPIVYEVSNADGSLLLGQTVGLVLFTDEAVSTLAVPETALVDEGGQTVLFVQIGGESFARRRVEIGIRDRGYVQLLNGVAEGERVVTAGAYEVRLASLSGQVPAEGHVH